MDPISKMDTTAITASVDDIIIAARATEREHWGDSIALADPCICKICVAIRHYDSIVPEEYRR